MDADTKKWSDEDYREMSLRIAGFMKQDVGVAVFGTMEEKESFLPSTWLSREMKFLKNIHDHGYTTIDLGSTEKVLATLSMLQKVLNCPSADALLYINEKEDIIRGVAAWRLENGR